MSRDYGDVPVGEMDYESHVVPEETDVEAYTGMSVDDILEDHEPETPPETLDTDWVDREKLIPNDWNPNFMPDHRKDLLVLSILDNGWTAPIVARAQDNVIVDGEHRWRLSGDKRLSSNEALTPDGVPEGFVPVHFVTEDRKQAMLGTYQQNYATGDDDATKLGELVDSLDEEGQDFAAGRMGVNDHELAMLLPDSGISGDATELWETPWDDADEPFGDSLFTERISFDMSLEEAKLVKHIFGDAGMARGIVSLTQFIESTDLYNDVEDVPAPDTTTTEEDDDE